MIERQYDAAHVNRIMNDPSYGVLWPAPVDMSVMFQQHPNVVLLCGEYGFLAAAPICDGVYDVHAGVLPAGRGTWCREAASEALAYLFEQIGVTTLLLRCPVGNLRASAGARMLGAIFHSVGRVSMPDLNRSFECNIFVLTLRRWLQLTNREN